MAARRRRLKRNTVIPVPPDRFAGGWRLRRRFHCRSSTVDIVVPPGAEPVETPSIVVDVTCGRDLVSLTAEFYGCELFNAEEGPVVRPLPDANARMLDPACRTSTSASGRSTRPRRRHPIRRTRTPRHIPLTRASILPTPVPMPPLEVRPARASRLGVLDRRRGHDLVQHRRDPRRDGPPGDDRPSAGDAEAGRPTHDVAGPDRRRCQEESRQPSSADGVAMSKATAAAVRAHRPRHPVPQPAPHAHDPVDAPRCGHPRRGHGRGRPVVDRRQRRRADRSRRSSAAAVSSISPDRIGVPRPRKRLSRPPTDAETAIEAPWRLVISPSDLGGGPTPPAPSAPTAPGIASSCGTPGSASRGRRRARRREGEVRSGSCEPCGRGTGRRCPSGRTLLVPPHDQDRRLPFRSSLDNGDRHMLVRQSAETWPGQGLSSRSRRCLSTPTRCGCRRSGPASTSTASGRRMPYSLAGIALDPAAGITWPRGAATSTCASSTPGTCSRSGSARALVKVTERKMKDAAPSTAGLYQRMFLVPGERIKTYDDRRLPFTEVFIAPGEVADHRGADHGLSRTRSSGRRSAATSASPGPCTPSTTSAGRCACTPR